MPGDGDVNDTSVVISKRQPHFWGGGLRFTQDPRGAPVENSQILSDYQHSL